MLILSSSLFCPTLPSYHYCQGCFIFPVCYLCEGCHFLSIGVSLQNILSPPNLTSILPPGCVNSTSPGTGQVDVRCQPQSSVCQLFTQNQNRDSNRETGRQGQRDRKRERQREAETERQCLRLTISQDFPTSYVLLLYYDLICTCLSLGLYNTLWCASMAWVVG